RNLITYGVRIFAVIFYRKSYIQSSVPNANYFGFGYIYIIATFAGYSCQLYRLLLLMFYKLGSCGKLVLMTHYNFYFVICTNINTINEIDYYCSVKALYTFIFCKLRQPSLLIGKSLRNTVQVAFQRHNRFLYCCNFFVILF